MAKNITVDDFHFAKAIGQQKVAANVMKDMQAKQTVFLNALAATWIGDGGVAFREAIKEVASQTLSGAFMIDSLANRTAMAHTVFSEADKELAKTS